MQIKTFFKNLGLVFKEAINGFIDDNAIKLSASLSYYTIFSLPPLLIIAISLSGLIFGANAVRGEVFDQIKDIVGDDAARQIQEAIKNIKLTGANTFATILGLIILLFGASGVFAEIQDSINFIWGVKAKPKKGLAKFIYNRLMSFSMIGAVGFLLLVSLILNSLLDVLSKRLTVVLPESTIILFYIINTIVVFAIITMLFTLIFKTLPDGKVPLPDCIIGAGLTALLFMIGRFGIGLYLSNSNVASIYGAAGSVVIILVWVYYSAIILYFGAEFTEKYSTFRGHKIIPNEYSVLITE